MEDPRPTPPTGPYDPTARIAGGHPAGVGIGSVPSEVSAALPAQRFGKFVRTEKLGAGGMGEVWKAWDTLLRRWVALKFLKGDDEDEVRRFRCEAVIAGRLNHPNIASVHEVGDDQGRTFIAMQYVNGCTLKAFADADRALIVRLMHDAALAVEFAHENGVVHRDLKPENIMVASRARPATRRAPAGTVQGHHVYVMDFGLARSVESGASITGAIVGTPAYMPPEQARGERADRRADVYSLGATLYYLLTRRPPFSGNNVLDTLKHVETQEPLPPRRVDRTIDADLETIVLKCVEKDPSRRYPTAQALAEDLARYLDGEAILARPPRLAYRLRKSARKRWPLLLAVAAGVFFAGAITIYLLPKLIRESEHRRAEESARKTETERRRSEEAARRSKEAELDDERERQAREDRVRDAARGHVDAGRRVLSRLDRELTLPDVTGQAIRALADEARMHFQRALAEDPRHPEALLEVARSYQLEGRRQETIDYCTKAVEAKPSFATAYLERAVTLVLSYEGLRLQSRVGPEEETPAAEEIRRQIEADLARVRQWSTDARELRLAEAMLSVAQGRFESGARALEQYATESISDFRGWLWAAYAWYHVKGAERQVDAAITRGLKYRPRSPYFLNLRGMARWQLGDRDGAVADFTAAINYNPRERHAHYNRGTMRQSAGDASGALADFSAEIELAPNDYYALVARGGLHNAVGRLDDAITDMSRAMQAAPRSATITFMRGALLMTKGHLPQAIADFDRALELNPAMNSAY